MFVILIRLLVFVLYVHKREDCSMLDLLFALAIFSNWGQNRILLQSSDYTLVNQSLYSAAGIETLHEN